MEGDGGDGDGEREPVKMLKYDSSLFSFVDGCDEEGDGVGFLNSFVVSEFGDSDCGFSLLDDVLSSL